MNYFKIILIGLLFSLAGTTLAQNADADRLEALVTELASDDFLGRGFGTEDGVRAADYIIQQYKESGIRPFMKESQRHRAGYRQRFDYRSGIINLVGNNIVGVIRGTDPDLADEYIVLGAHYDHVGWEFEGGDTVVYNGADDNASGVASITEIGRILNDSKESLGRSVIFIAFDGEESGLVGSNVFVDELIMGANPLIERESIVAMINLDMVGMYEAHGGVDLLGWDLLENADQLLNNINEASPIEVTKTTGSIPNRTDTTPFGEIGIPAIHVFTETESPYHKPEDDSDLLDYEGMAVITDFVASTVKELSTISEVPKSKEMQKIAEQGTFKYFNPGVTLNLGGTHFNYRDDYRKAKGVFSYGAGFMFETRVSEWLAIQPEVVYEWGGSQVYGGALRTHSVSVPLSVLLTTPDESGYGVRAYYQAGAYYSYIFGVNVPDVNVDFPGGFNEYDYGYIFGFGMEIMNFRMGYFFKSSLVDFSIGGLDVRQKGMFMKVGWVF